MRLKLGILLTAIGIVAVFAGSVEATQKTDPPKSIAELGCEAIHSNCTGGCGPLNACSDACQRCQATCNQKLTLCQLENASKKKSKRKTNGRAGGGVERNP
jgi:hypothetical protein